MKLGLSILLFLVSVPLLADSVGMVIYTEGHNFASNHHKSVKLKYGDKLKEGSEVLVGVDSVVGLLTNDGEKVYLSSQSQAKFKDGFVELQKGQAWIQGAYQNHSFGAYTANAHAEIKSAYIVLKYNEETKTSQILSIRGQSYFYNINEPNAGVQVVPGTFSQVSMNYNNGMPRKPLRVGQESYQNLKLSYKGVTDVERVGFETLFVEKKKNRSIASVLEGKRQTSKRARLIYHKEGGGQQVSNQIEKFELRQPASKTVYQKEVQEVIDQNVMAIKGRNMGVYSIYPSKSTRKTNVQKTVYKMRDPASLKTYKVRAKRRKPAAKKKAVPRRTKKKSSFERSLNKKFNNNQRHDKDVNSLIKELKSFKTNYKSDY
jgi:hypothetical protein